jgi:uncharacterized repeat protein (TIGR03803 family)
MKLWISLAFLSLLFTSSAFATDMFTPVFTLACNGSPSRRTGPCPDGGRAGALSMGTDGNFYGAGQDSMEGSSAPNGGTVFSLTPSGTFKLLHTFTLGTSNTYPNGNSPGFLRQGPDGKIYGTTLFGGNYGCNGYCGFGVLYRVNSDGSGFKILHKFCAQTNCTDGGESVSGLALGTDGNLYGTSFAGGTGNSGTIYKITVATGAYQVVFNFSYSNAGETPSGLVVASDGTFYGLASSSLGETLFHYVVSTDTVTSVPLNFPLFNGLPSSGGLLTLGPNGNFYGVYGIYGVSGEGIFEVEPDGTNLQLFPFYTTIDGGGAPQNILLASDDNFWISNFNGSNGEGYGDIIAISPADGSLIQTLSPFSATAAVGAYPAELLQAPNGILWGSTYSFGRVAKNHFGDGTVFKLNAGLPPR